MVTRDTAWVPGTPCWVDLSVDSVEKATAFYGALFGWQIEDGNVQGGGHIANTRFPMGFAPPSSGSREVTVYFRVDDVATYAARVVELGGQVLDTNDYASGGGAECIDDQGQRFDLWKPAPGY